MPLNINVQIHISAEATGEQIESIFTAMRRYLYGGYGRQEDYLSVRIHGFTIYRRSRNPRPSKIAGIAFSIRAVRVPDCFAPAK